MKRPALVYRREIWLPTIWGWLVLLLAGAAAAVFVALNLFPFLALTQPVGARILVIEGWMRAEELDQAVATFRAGGYQRVLTTGGPLDWQERQGPATYAERAADYLKQRGLAPASVTAVPAPKSAQERTFLSAVMVREWAKSSGGTIDAIDVFSSGAHARRSHLLYRLAFGPNVKVGVHAARPYGYNPDAWWITTAGLREVIEQAFGLLRVECCFRPPPPGSPEERWNVPGMTG